MIVQEAKRRLPGRVGLTGFDPTMSGVGDLRASSISRAGSTDYGYLDTLSTGRNNLETENLIRREMDATPGNNSPVDGQSMGPESPHVASDSHQTRKLPETDKLSLANASAADREIAHGVWTTSENREDEVRDALGRMINWVDQLVRLFVRFGPRPIVYPCTRLQPYLDGIEWTLDVGPSDSVTRERGAGNNSSSYTIELGSCSVQY